MADGFKLYRRAVEKALPCRREVRESLLNQMERFQKGAAENDALPPTYPQLVENYGPPEQFAQTLMASVPQQELTAYRQEKRFVQIVLGVLAAILFAFTIYTWFIKEYTFYEISLPEDISESDISYSIPPTSFGASESENS